MRPDVLSSNEHPGGPVAGTGRAEKLAISAIPAPPQTPIEPGEVLDLLTALVQKSLVVYEEAERSQGRYWFDRAEYKLVRIVPTREPLSIAEAVPV